MRKYILVALVLLGVGLGVSFYLIPTQRVVVGGAPNTIVQPADATKVDVEAEYSKGNHSFPIVAGLADKRVNTGDKEGAVKLLEEYVAANGNDANGHKKLAELYQLTGNKQGYQQELEALVAAAPTEANLRLLSDLYNADKEYAKQAAVLQKIIDVTKGANPQSYVDLATIQVVIGDEDAALKTVQDLKAKFPAFASYPLTRIMVSVLANKAKPDDAFAAAKQWMDTPGAPVPAPPPAAPQAAQPSVNPESTTTSKAKDLADLCNILHYAGYADKAVALVDLYPELLQTDPELVLAYVNANITAGRADHAYTVLKTIDDAGAMTAALYVPYLDLTLKREDTPSAEAIATKIDVATFNEELALKMLDVARANDAPSTMKILTTRFAAPAMLQDKPVLNAVIAILTNDKTQDDKIAAALKVDLTSTQRLSLADACVRAQKTPCFEAIVKLYPPLEQMLPTQVAEYAQLFIIGNRAEELVDPVGKLTQVEHPQAQVQLAHRRLAAAAGRYDVLKTWLAQNANTVPISQLQELFYLANDHKHHDIASDVAERLYARDPSPMNRDIKIAAYMGAGEYAKAVPLLREQVQQTGGANDGQYLAALAKLAHKDAAARKELTDYAQAALQSKHGDNRQQLNYAYILVGNGRKDVALPYAKQYASERGGEWKKMYAQLTKTGGAGEKLTRAQMLAMAKAPSASAATKRQIAFNLLKEGYREDATGIFQELASSKGPDSQEVQDLLYIWGGKLNAAQLAWVEKRAATASPYDKDRWAALINNVADDHGVLAYVGAAPDALYNKALRQRYFRVLAATGNRSNYDAAMREWVAGTTDIPALIDYATIAENTGYTKAATNGYERVLQLDPANDKALNRLAVLDFSKGRFRAADQKLTQYLNEQKTEPDAASDPAQAHFYKAQLLRREGKTKEARTEFEQVVAATAQSGVTAPDALSRLYTSMFHLGQVADAKTGFEQLLEQHPDDKGVLADYMSVLIEYNYLDDATRIANQYDKNSPYYQGSSMLVGRSAHTAKIERLSDGREMKISFAEPIEGVSPFDTNAAKNAAWLERSETGYDSVSLSAKPGYVIRYQPTSDEQFEVVASPAPQYTPQVEAERQQALRLQLLYARIEQETGQNERAQQRLEALNYYYPNDPQLLSYQASLASSNGEGDRAAKLIAKAQEVAPDNEDFTLQAQNIRHVDRNADYVKLDHQYTRLGDNDEQITTLSGAGHADRLELGFNAQNNFLATEGTRRASDGQIDDYTVTRQRGEVYAAYNYVDGGRAQASLFGNNQALGGGLSYAFNNPIGRTELIGEYQRPYWDFVEAVYDHATRDRVGFKHFTTLQPGTTLGLEASLNNYNIDEQDDVAQTTLLRANLVQQLQPQTASQPYLGVGYGFDGEYLADKPDSAFDAAGNYYYLLPVRTREVHALTGIYRDTIAEDTNALLVGGVAYDRLNGSFSPLLEARVDHDVNEKVQLGGRARYALDTNNTDNKALDLGADVIYKF